MKNYCLFITAFAFVLTGCVSQYKNPTGIPTTPVFGSFYTSDEVLAFWKEEYSFAKNISGTPFKEPVIHVAFVDGSEVSNGDRPVYVTEGPHVLRLMLTDRVTRLMVEFKANIDISIKYAVKFRVKDIENTKLADIWIENHETGEILTDVKTAAMLPVDMTPTVIPILL